MRWPLVGSIPQDSHSIAVLYLGVAWRFMERVSISHPTYLSQAIDAAE